MWSNVFGLSAAPNRNHPTQNQSLKSCKTQNDFRAGASWRNAEHDGKSVLRRVMSFLSLHIMKSVWVTGNEQLNFCLSVNLMESLQIIHPNLTQSSFSLVSESKQPPRSRTEGQSSLGKLRALIIIDHVGFKTVSKPPALPYFALYFVNEQNECSCWSFCCGFYQNKIKCIKTNVRIKAVWINALKIKSRGSCLLAKYLVNEWMDLNGTWRQSSVCSWLSSGFKMAATELALTRRWAETLRGGRWESLTTRALSTFNNTSWSKTVLEAIKTILNCWSNCNSFRIKVWASYCENLRWFQLRQNNPLGCPWKIQKWTLKLTLNRIGTKEQAGLYWSPTSSETGTRTESTEQWRTLRKSAEQLIFKGLRKSSWRGGWIKTFAQLCVCSNF